MCAHTHTHTLSLTHSLSQQNTSNDHIINITVITNVNGGHKVEGEWVGRVLSRKGGGAMDEWQKGGTHPK